MTRSARRSAGAVSYTHLDVYKRQVEIKRLLERAPHLLHGRFGVRPAGGRLRKKIAATLFHDFVPEIARGLYPDGVPPVSYTHLDVYKRQVKYQLAGQEENVKRLKTAFSAVLALSMACLLYTSSRQRSSLRQGCGSGF